MSSGQFPYPRPLSRWERARVRGSIASSSDAWATPPRRRSGSDGGIADLTGSRHEA